MTPRPDDVGPERLAELADGAPPRDAAERELMALMAEVRDLEEPTPDALRARVRAIAAGEAEPGRVRRWRAGRRRLLVAAAPVAAGIVALAIAIPAMTGGSGDTAPAGATSEPLRADSVAPAAPESSAGADAPATARAAAPSAAGAAGAVARLRLTVEDAAAVDAAVRRVRALGGSVVTETGEGRIVRLVVRVPADRAAEALDALGRLGEVTGRREAAPSPAGEVTIRVTITVGG